MKILFLKNISHFRQYQLGNEEIKLILKQIENNRREETQISIGKNSIEWIKYLLKTIDHLEDYFPNIHQQFSIDHQSSSISVSHPHVHFLMK